MNSDYYVYVLFRHDGRPFYVGKGRGYRWSAHEIEASQPSARGHKVNTIRDTLFWLSEVPKVKVAEGLTSLEALAIEITFIKAIGRKPDGPLVNLTDGGDGNPGFKLSDNHILSMSVAKLGKKNTPGMRAKMSALARNRSPETLAKMSVSSRAVWTLEKRAEMRDIQKAVWTPEKRTAHSAYQKELRAERLRLTVTSPCPTPVTPRKRTSC